MENGLTWPPGWSARAPPLYSRQIVGWELADNMLESLVREPLEKALLKRKVKSGLIIHSDRGGQSFQKHEKIGAYFFSRTEHVAC